MSVQSEWQPASRKKPAEFDLDYVTIKVQSFKASDSKIIQVRLATSFNAGWMEDKFTDWYDDMIEDVGGDLEPLYPLLKRLRSTHCGDDLALINNAINALERANTGLIRG